MVPDPAPDLSVITPVLNGAPHIDACLESTAALGRGGVCVEHIVVDGGSTDATLDRLAAWGQAKVLKRPGAGPHEACNIGLTETQGRAVAFLMADDVWTDGAATAFARALAAPGWDVALFAADLVEEMGRRRLTAPLRLWRVLRAYPGLNSALIKADLARRLCFSSQFRAVHDRLLMIDALALATAIRCSDECVVQLNAHDGSLTMSPARDVVTLKVELNALAARLSASSCRGPARDVFALWHLQSALSLSGDSLLAASRGERRIARPQGVRTNFPTIGAWARALHGVAAIVAGGDAFVAMPNEREVNQPRRDIGLTAPTQLSGAAAIC